ARISLQKPGSQYLQVRNDSQREQQRNGKRKTCGSRTRQPCRNNVCQSCGKRPLSNDAVNRDLQRKRHQDAKWNGNRRQQENADQRQQAGPSQSKQPLPQRVTISSLILLQTAHGSGSRHERREKISQTPASLSAWLCIRRLLRNRKTVRLLW